MALRPTRVVRINPLGTTDSEDGSNTPVGDASTPGQPPFGSMQAITNLVPSPTTRSIFVPRPAALPIADFGAGSLWDEAEWDEAVWGAFDHPEKLEALIVVGDMAYGLVASDDITGHSVPFAVDLTTGVFIDIDGPEEENTPTSQPPTGEWTPPSIAMVGTSLLFTSDGFSGDGDNYFGVLDLSDPSAPVWTADNTGTNALPEVPTVVFEFFGRAWFVIGNTLFFTDILEPLVITNADQFLVCGDTTPIVALGGTPLNTMTQGGIIQSLIAFKNSIYYQITGDYTLDTLLLNAATSGIGTYAPNSLAGTPSGLAFIAPDGLRIVGFDGNVTDPIGSYGDGISVPFINAVFSSRLAAAFNEGLYRVTTNNPDPGGVTQYQEFWYNTARGLWSGPHTCTAQLIAGWRKSFVMAPMAADAMLWKSDWQPIPSSTYVENGAQMLYNFRTTLLPVDHDISEVSVTESGVMLGFIGVSGQTTVTMFDEGNAVLDQVTIEKAVSQTLWDTARWDIDVWDGSVYNYQLTRIPWTVPIVMAQSSLQFSGECFEGFKIGNMFLRYQVLGNLPL